MTVQITLNEYIESQTTLVDESPVMNDKDYAEVITTPATLYYTVDDVEYKVSGEKSTKADLIQQAIRNTIWNTWYYENGGEDKTFTELGLSKPSVYDPEEDATFYVDFVGTFIDAKGLFPSTEFNRIKLELLHIAESEVKIKVIDPVEDYTFVTKTIEGVKFELVFNPYAPERTYDSVPQLKIDGICHTVYPVDILSVLKTILNSHDLESIIQGVTGLWCEESITETLTDLPKGGD